MKKKEEKIKELKPHAVEGLSQSINLPAFFMIE
jgi:hypothetical protein